MSRNLGSSGLYNETLIDERNARPLTIAFATMHGVRKNSSKN